MLKAIHAQEDREAAMEKGASVKEKLLAMRLGAAAKILEAGLGESLSYMSFPREHRIRIRTNNAMEKLNQEIRRRTRVVGNFPDGQSALMLVAARLRHVPLRNGEPDGTSTWTDSITSTQPRRNKYQIQP
jgi:transposase-like protein